MDPDQTGPIKSAHCAYKKTRPLLLDIPLVNSAYCVYSTYKKTRRLLVATPLADSAYSGYYAYKKTRPLLVNFKYL